jgi:hypothetical protein
MDNRISERLKIVTTCNNHIGGLLGEYILGFFLKEKLIKSIDDVYIITDKGWEDLEIIGIDVDKLRSIKRKIINICIESNDGILFEHIGSYLGAFFMERMIELGWLKEKDEIRYELTERGFTGLESLGVVIKTMTTNNYM